MFLCILNILSRLGDLCYEHTPTEKAITFTTFNGGIYKIKTLLNDDNEFLNKLQQCILQQSENIGQLKYSFMKKGKHSVYIDGDILKRYCKEDIIIPNSPLLSSKYKVEELINSLVS